jgi:hypothetical protein
MLPYYPFQFFFIFEVFLGYNDGNGVFVGSDLNLYSEDLGPTEILRKSFETAVEDD